MINLNGLLDERAFGHDVDSLQAANEYLERLLFATARKHNQVWEELESMKESSGIYDKSLPFLSFPREVRDQIYKYALQATREAFVGVRHIRMLSCDTFPDSTHYPFKPPTPGLLLVNKQIYEEAVQILYSCNNFSFHRPRELFDFQNQVGVYNCGLVRQMKISVVFGDESMYTPVEYVAPCDYENISSHWAKALLESRLMSNIVGMQVDANTGSHEMRLMTMPPSLYRAIIATFSRNRSLKTAPELILKGFQTQEVEKFPKHWKRSTEQWLEVDWASDVPEQELDESEPFWNSSEADLAETSDNEDGESFDEGSSYIGGSSTGKGNVPTLFNELGELMGSDYTDSDTDSDVGSEDSFYTAAPWNDVKEVLLQFRSFQEAGQRQQGGLLSV
ncbi:hypothetical protein BcDW1_4927 [Botrytis cinerea BcDW1]|uniref:F-box domain-containing protein n=2 Tax=Botryotinia fuckeliana TaxID=40559 RepID=G2Y688_BOTF4|nr:hypothetical protein BcDW1_4927 [Botrytis cinerea BcDW1]CCD48140.1 hypothetical protein BofuT4_P111530.1 [Botrytis cinerea T4]